MPSKSRSRVLTNHDEIRQWAESRGAAPTCVRGTGGGEDIGMIRLDFPGYSGEQSLQDVSWDEWFRQFDENDLALLVQDEMASGQQSNFNKLINRRTAYAASEPRRSRAGSRRRSASSRNAAKASSKRRTRSFRASKSGISERSSKRGQSRGQSKQTKQRGRPSRGLVAGEKKPAMATRGKSTRSARGRSTGTSGRRAA